MKRPFGDGAVAEETGDDPRAFLHLKRQRHSRGERDAAPHDGDARHHPFVHVSHVHRAPLPRQQPVLAPKSSKSKALGREPLGESVAVAPKRGGDKVGRLERRANAHGRRLLSLALVNRAGHRSLEEQELHPVLELADQDHPPVQFEEKVARVIRRGDGAGARFRAACRFFSKNETRGPAVAADEGVRPFGRSRGMRRPRPLPLSRAGARPPGCRFAIDGERRDDLAGRGLATRGNVDRLERAGHGRLQLHDRFVGFDFHKRLTAADRLTDLGKPLHDLDRVVNRAQVGHSHRDFHHSLPASFRLAAAAEQLDPFEHGVAHRQAAGHQDILRAAHPQQAMGVGRIAAESLPDRLQVPLFEIGAEIDFGHPQRDRRSSATSAEIPVPP